MIKRRLRHLRAFLRRLIPGSGWRRRLGQRLAWLALAVLMGYFILNFISTSLDISRLDRQIADVEAQNAAIAAENQQLEGELAYTESDAYVERAAREQLGMAREGESVIIPQIVALEPTPATQPAPAPAQLAQNRPNWQRWLDALRGEF